MSRPQPAPDAPHPLQSGDCRPLFAALASGEPFRGALEALLRSLEPEARDRLTHLLRESSGAWVGVVRAPFPGRERALMCGNAFSGSLAALEAAGWCVTVLDASRERLAFARAAALARGPRTGSFVHGGLGDGLPFAQASFDLVVLEQGPGRPPAATLDEARRVARGELFLAVDNRLGYKRSSGRYWDFRVLGPLEYLRRAFARGGSAATLAAWRRALSAPGWDTARAFALYPDRRDFAYVAALGAPGPTLFVGPSERKNRLKVAAQRAGLVPLLTPSFGLRVARRGSSAPALHEHVLASLAERIGLDRPPRLEHLVATRGNVGVWLTQPAAAGDSRPPGQDLNAGERPPAGAWALHVLLSPHHRSNLADHAAFLARLQSDYPGVPAPRPLYHGRLAAHTPWLTCEERLGGFSAHHRLDASNAPRLVAGVASHLAQLVTRERPVLDEQTFATLVETRFARVSAKVGARTRERLARLLDEARECLLGRPLARALQHGDLRPKHVQLDSRRRILGYFDWATSRVGDLPLLDLCHLWLHSAKQVLRSGQDGYLWRRLAAGQLEFDGRGALAASRASQGPQPRGGQVAASFEAYARSAGLDEQALRGLILVYPAWVGWIAESFWPYSRPGWFERYFEL